MENWKKEYNLLITDNSNEFYDITGLIYCFMDLIRLGFSRDHTFSGLFIADDVPMLLDYCKRNPTYHLITVTGSGRYENRFIAGERFYYLGNGDKDPDLVLDLLLYKSEAEFMRVGFAKALAIISDDKHDHGPE
jgi:hypothetical protein